MRDDLHLIGIIGAMEEEIELLRNGMSGIASETHASMTFFKGRIGTHEAVVVKSGIGKVNMAVCAQILADIYCVDAMINTGVAGSLDNRIDIGDIVIAEDAVHHDMDTSVFGDPRGQVPRMDILAFPTDRRLCSLAEAANAKVNRDIHSFCGRIASGDQFIAGMSEKKDIVREFGALCCDMEGVAMAQTAYLNNIPCLIIRAVSDKADHSATMDYQEFEKKAIEHTTRLLVALLESM